MPILLSIVYLNMNKYVVKIIANGVSTGFIHFPVNSEEAYVICSLHGIADKHTLVLVERIEIKFFDSEKSSYHVASTDQVIKGRSTTDEDIAAIVIPRSKVPIDIGNERNPRL